MNRRASVLQALALLSLVLVPLCKVATGPLPLPFLRPKVLPTLTPYPTPTPFDTPTAAPTATIYPTYTPLPSYTPPPTYTPYPTFTPVPTDTPIPTPEEQPTYVFTFIPPSQLTLTPPPIQAPAVTVTAFRIVSFTPKVVAGNYARLVIKTNPSTNCAIYFNDSAGAKVIDAGLKSKTADLSGVCVWNWKVGPRTPTGMGTVQVVANGQTLVLKLTILPSSPDNQH